MTLFNLFSGKKLRRKFDGLSAELASIESANINWFRERAGKTEGDPHDRLHHHYILKSHIGQIRFSIIEESDLPEEIQEQCLHAFYRHF